LTELAALLLAAQKDGSCFATVSELARERVQPRRSRSVEARRRIHVGLVVRATREAAGPTAFTSEALAMDGRKTPVQRVSGVHEAARHDPRLVLVPGAETVDEPGAAIGRGRGRGRRAGRGEPCSPPTSPSPKPGAMPFFAREG
jgi:hypothetical protein